MMIQEAAKSGKRFKRKQWAEFAREIGHPEIILQCDKTKEFLRISLNDLLATDWVIEEKKVEITYEELKKAIDKFIYLGAHTFPSSVQLLEQLNNAINMIAKELGLL